MKRTSMVVVAALFAVVGSAVAQQVTTVVGTGDPNVDVPAVQAAVDQGGSVVLQGRFSFDAPPTQPDGALYARTVTVSKSVAISGVLDDSGEKTTIAGGFVPFFIDAKGARVAIRGLHFARPKGVAVWAYAAGGLAVADCWIEGIEPSTEYGSYAGGISGLSNGIFVGSDPHPGANPPGIPENFSGTLNITDNDVDMGGVGGSASLGIVVFKVGRSPDGEVDIYVSGNRVRNSTEVGINFRFIGARVHIERNTISTGVVAGSTANPDAIRIVGSGSYVIAHNSIDCGWAHGQAAGINIWGPQATLAPASGALLADNDINMSAPDGTQFGTTSAAIAIRGYAQNNAALNNRIDQGIARIRENVSTHRRVAVFTSGGVIASTVRIALDLAPQRTLELSWTSRNASYTEFLTSRERFSLSSFNNHPHLEDEELLTYR